MSAAHHIGPCLTPKGATAASLQPSMHFCQRLQHPLNNPLRTEHCAYDLSLSGLYENRRKPFASLYPQTAPLSSTGHVWYCSSPPFKLIAEKGRYVGPLHYRMGLWVNVVSACPNPIPGTMFCICSSLTSRPADQLLTPQFTPFIHLSSHPIHIHITGQF